MLKVRSYKPDVAIVDIRMPPTHTDEGLRAAKEIRERHPETGVLVLSQYVETEYAMELLAESAEGVGYLLKDRVADIAEFAAAVRRVADGGSALDPSIVSLLVGRRRGSDPLDELTPREREVLELMAEGRSNQRDRRAAWSSPSARSRSTSRASSASCGSPPRPSPYAGLICEPTNASRNRDGTIWRRW